MIYLDKEGKFQDTHEAMEQIDEAELDDLWEDEIKDQLIDWFHETSTYCIETDYDGSKCVCINDSPRFKQVVEELKDIMKDMDLKEEEQEYILDTYMDDNLYDSLCEYACGRESDRLSD